MLCYAMLCYTILCYANVMLYYTILCYAILYYNAGAQGQKGPCVFLHILAGLQLLVERRGLRYYYYLILLLLLYYAVVN